MIKVLVVDDSPTVRMVLAKMLEADPEIKVVGQAEDGTRAVEMALKLKPDLVTMDLVMPGMGGGWKRRSASWPSSAYRSFLSPAMPVRRN